jgi:hypothetical protein
MKKIKPEYILTAVIGILSTTGAVEAFYEHPTYGRGLQALFAVITFGRFL